MERLIRFDWSRACPLCKGTESTVSHPEQGEGRVLHSQSFTSRKNPERVYPTYRKCDHCDLVYASPALRPDSLDYEAADFIASEESRLAAQSYFEVIEPYLQDLPEGSAVDIGCGDGEFLARLEKGKFVERVGYEPSALARVYRPGVRLEAAAYEGQEKEAALVTAFQVLEHLSDPLETLRKIRKGLRPGGLFYAVSHNERSLAHRALGPRSPLLDLQHFQIFSPKTLRRALSDCGFRDVRTFTFSNNYPLHYWAKLAPVPAPTKEWLKKRPWASRRLRLSLGNFATLAWA